jgi:hypothetical protein
LNTSTRFLEACSSAAIPAFSERAASFLPFSTISAASFLAASTICFASASASDFSRAASYAAVSIPSFFILLMSS